MIGLGVFISTNFVYAANTAHTDTFAQLHNPFYISANLGFMTANFNVKYLDNSDTIAQNFQDTVSQDGYNTGIAIGYSHLIWEQYLLGAEIDMNRLSNSAHFSAGAPSAGFADKLKLKYSFDFLFVPGVLLTNSLAAYLKLGISSGYVYDKVVSPVGYNPGYVPYHNNLTPVGFVGGIGLKKYLNSHWSVFSEYVYHDYGSMNFTTFGNFTGTYGHSTRLYENSIAVGLGFNF